MISPESDKKLFLLDAYALIFRAYYAFIRNPRINTKGMNTSAMFGFTNVLLDVLKNEKPSHLAVVFDPPEGNFRSETFADYKANREETPEDIRVSVPWIMKILKGFGVPIIMVNGFEADDVIGAIAKHAEKDGFQTFMMTPDKDFGQLVSENIFIFKPGRQGNPPEIWGPKEVCERYQIERPEQVIDILGLMGDAVDNIPGVPGIGEKTAMKLIGQYGSIEGLYEHTHELKGKQKENVENHKEQAYMSKHLATIVTEIDFHIDYPDMEISPINKDLLRETFEELEFRTLSRRVLGEDTSARDGEQISLFGEAQEEVVAEEIVLSTLETTAHSYELVQGETAKSALIATLMAATEFSFDTETTGLDPLEADLVGMSFSIASHSGWYVPVPGNFEEQKEFLNDFRGLFSATDKLLIGQNIKFDYKMMARYGIHIANRLFDTMIAHYLMSPDGKHGMDVLAEQYLKYRPIPIEELIGKKGKNQGNMSDLLPEELVNYATEDADVTLQLKHTFAPEIEKPHLKSLFENVELPLLRVLADMETEGVNLDTAGLREYAVSLRISIEELETEIHSLAGETFNVDSPKQLGVILFEKLGIGSNNKTTKTGQYSTGEDVLSKLEHEHAIIGKILDYRQLRKLLSTYVEPLPEMVSKVTGRLHTQYMQTVAATGRLSSNNPNLQNIPIRTEKGREIRKAFIPRGEGYSIMSADYSQVELRIIAALSEDESMVEAFRSGHDIHAATASKVFGVALEEVTREMRSKAKAVNFGIIYGQGAFGLAQNLNIKRSEAKDIIDNYYAQFSKLKSYQADVITLAREHGYVETILGRRRYLPDIHSANAVVRGFAERNAINAPIQGSAADIIKLAMIKIQDELKKGNFKSRMIMQVHDELVFDVYDPELEMLKEIVVRHMRDAHPLIVPLDVEVGVGQTWLAAH
ncbi:MAG: DNA polymerase I [Cryomorphaceae bacterium]|nr:DNA polymerase I [Cryomorphaceae bacterium]